MANAQAWLPDRKYTEGPGVRVGDLELHPGVAVRAGWDSNVFRSDGRDRSPRLSSGLIAITPHINLTTLGTQRMAEGEGAAANSSDVQPKIAFTSGVAATYFQYLKSEAQPQGVNIGIDTDTLLKILPSRPVSLDLGFGYQRYVQPFTERVLTGNYAGNTFAPLARLNMGSRSHVLSSYIGYAPIITYFEKKADGFNYLNAANHVAQVGAAWKFLPHTALLFDSEAGFQNYFDDPNQRLNGAVYLSDSRRFQGRLGINGAFTNKLSLRLMAGYAMMTFDSNYMSQYENAIGEAILGYRFGRANQFDVGYIGALTPSSIGGWMRSDRGFARIRSVIGGAFSLGLEAGGGYATYGRALRPGPTATSAPLPLGEDGDTSRKDVRIDGAVRTEYRITNWLALMADFISIATLTNFKYDQLAVSTTTPVATPLPVPDPARFIDFQVYGGVRAHY